MAIMTMMMMVFFRRVNQTMGCLTKRKRRWHGGTLPGDDEDAYDDDDDDDAYDEDGDDDSINDDDITGSAKGKGEGQFSFDGEY